MPRFSNTVNHNSSDGLARNPWPVKPIVVACRNEDCGEDIETEVCPHCGTENVIEYEPIEEQEYDPDEDN